MSIALNEDEFWNISPAANEIFKYKDNHSELVGGAWGFDRGGISHDGKTSYALFSAVALTGWGEDELNISATLQSTGAWKLAHTIKRAG